MWESSLNKALGNNGCQPPRNNSVATHVMVTMLAYSDMKKHANFILLYSVWKPATSSFSASGRSKGDAVRFGETSNHKNKEAENLREGSSEKYSSVG